MITYICHNRNPKTGEKLPCTDNRCETSICPSCGGRADAVSEIYWCHKCQVPIYDSVCPCCKEVVVPGYYLVCYNRERKTLHNPNDYAGF